MNEYIITLHLRDGATVKLEYYNRDLAERVFQSYVDTPHPDVWRAVLSRIMLVQIDSWEE